MNATVQPRGKPGSAFTMAAAMVCDGAEAAARRIRDVLTNDPASGVVRHADAGYEDAIACAAEHGLDLPMIDSARRGAQSSSHDR